MAYEYSAAMSEVRGVRLAACSGTASRMAAEKERAGFSSRHSFIVRIQI